tara:strand:- start:1639 stop:1941 length:303 start_codon:yes stop_codon:yes gene_type:complete
MSNGYFDVLGGLFRYTDSGAYYLYEEESNKIKNTVIFSTVILLILFLLPVAIVAGEQKQVSLENWSKNLYPIGTAITFIILCFIQGGYTTHDKIEVSAIS